MEDYRSVADLLTMKTRRFVPDLMWGPDDHLYWGPPESGIENLGEYQLQFGNSKRDVRSAVNQFLRIAREYEASANDAELKRAVARFATIFGDLTGWAPSSLSKSPTSRRLPDTLSQWRVEVLTVLDAYELRTAQRKGDHIRNMTNRLEASPDGDSVWFKTRTGVLLPISHGTRRITVKSRKDDEPRTLEPAKIARNGGRQLNWMIFGRLVESRLAGQISLATDPGQPGNIGITPAGVVPTIYARLLLDYLQHVDDSQLVRSCANPSCDKPIPEGSRLDRNYCSGTCQKADRRRILRELGMARLQR